MGVKKFTLRASSLPARKTFNGRAPGGRFARRGSFRYNEWMRFPRRSTRPGFTLLELCIVMALAVLLLAVAMPSLSGQLARKRLQDSFDRFDALVGEARRHSVAAGKPFVLVWRKGGIFVYPSDQSDEDRRKDGAAAALDFSGASDGQCELLRGASLTADPAPEWTIWPTGNCEPVVVRYEGPPGNWEASYNGLSGQATLNKFIAR